jgi:hypothetical protein
MNPRTRSVDAILAEAVEIADSASGAPSSRSAAAATQR